GTAGSGGAGGFGGNGADGGNGGNGGNGGFGGINGTFGTNGAGGTGGLGTLLGGHNGNIGLNGATGGIGSTTLTNGDRTAAAGEYHRAGGIHLLKRRPNGARAARHRIHRSGHGQPIPDAELRPRHRDGHRRLRRRADLQLQHLLNDGGFRQWPSHPADQR
ncbi:PE family protein, partial [Mycobacterium tuberculosis]